MPQVVVELRWPDGSRHRLTSPSRTIRQALGPGLHYRRDELLRRCEAALEQGSERVRARYGHHCPAAAGEWRALRAAAAEHCDHDHDPVAVERVDVVADRGPRRRPVGGHREVVVVGGGHAGLSVSHHLAAHGIDHLVLERDRVASSWRTQRWDAFHLVTPNWQCALPGHPYAGDDPEGFMTREEVVRYVEDFARRSEAPVAEGCAVRTLDHDGAAFVVSTSMGEVRADQVVLAVGGYHRPSLPPLAARLPAHVAQVHSSRYRTPAAMPDGAVLVVGSGQSGAQIAEDLLLAGRRVHLCVGSAPRVARRYRGRDCVAWLHDMGHYDMPVEEHPLGVAARREPNHYVTGRDGGRDIDLRAHARDGMRLHGRLLGVEDGVLRLADDLHANLAGADAAAERIKDAIDAHIARSGIEAPVEPRYAPVFDPPPGAAALDLEAEGITSVVWATGFRSDWSWVRLPAFDGEGYPVHHRGVTSVPGLYVLGLPWLHTWGSGRFAGVDRDARHVADRLAARRRAGAADVPLLTGGGRAARRARASRRDPSPAPVGAG